MSEYYFNFQSDSGSLTEDHALYKWGSQYRIATETNRDPRIGGKLKDLLRASGLVSVRSKYIAIPIGGWSHGGRQQCRITLSRHVAHGILNRCEVASRRRAKS